MNLNRHNVYYVVKIQEKIIWTISLLYTLIKMI